jgi:hypothetical protein
MPVNRMMLLPSNPLHNQPIRIAPVCIQAAYTVTTAKRVRQILAADLECFPAGADAGAHPFAVDTYVGFKLGGVIHTCLPPPLQRDDGFIFRVGHGGSVHSSFYSSIFDFESPHPFGCAQGRLCRKESDKDRAPWTFAWLRFIFGRLRCGAGRTSPSSPCHDRYRSIPLCDD